MEWVAFHCMGRVEWHWHWHCIGIGWAFESFGWVIEVLPFGLNHICLCYLDTGTPYHGFVVLKSCTSEMRLVRRSAYNWGSGASVAKGNTLEGLYWLMVISNG